MRLTESLSSSPGERLIEVSLDLLNPYPANPNVMSNELLEKLTENIRREGDYPPLIVRPDPDHPDAYQILDGHNRKEALQRLGQVSARCYLWPCDDQTALVLMATLNRLEGQDNPGLRAELIRELSNIASLEELALLLPEDAISLEQSLALLDLDLDSLLADLQPGEGGGSGLRSITFAVTTEDEARIEAAVSEAMKQLEGQNRRGRALASIAQHFLEEVER